MRARAPSDDNDFAALTQGGEMGTHATREQFYQALDALGEGERISLRRLAKFYAGRNSGFESGDDLLGEVFIKVAEGERRWPLQVDLVVFLGNAMSSLADNQRKLVRRTPSRWVSMTPPEGSDANAEDGEHLDLEPRPSAEQEAIANERRRMAQAAVDFAGRMLQGDQEAYGVLERMANGYAAGETREEMNLDDAGYKAARERVRLRLNHWLERGRP